MLFQKKKSRPEEISKKFPYDSQKQKAVLKCSICNGEQVAGFKDIATGKFEEIMFIRDSRDLEGFMKAYGLTDIAKEY